MCGIWLRRRAYKNPLQEQWRGIAEPYLGREIRQQPARADHGRQIDQGIHRSLKERAAPQAAEEKAAEAAWSQKGSLTYEPEVRQAHRADSSGRRNMACFG